MSKISQDFINNLGSLYEEIHVKDQDFLNEESEYYDEESAELVEDIIISLALSMFSEGYTAETFVKFLSTSNEEDILEKYFNTDISFISEETIYNNFVEEQLELLEVAGLIKLLGRGAKAAASGMKATKGAVKAGVTKTATAGVEGRVGRQLARSTDPKRTIAAIEKVAKNKATKAGVTVPQGSLSPKQSTELIKQARTVKAIKSVKDASKLALVGGLGVAGGYMGAKLGSGSGDGKVGPAIVGPKIVGPKIVGPKIVGPKSSSPSGGGGSNSSGGGGGSSTSPSGFAKPVPSAAAAPKKSESGTAMQQWAKANPKLAAKVKPGQSGYEEISAMRSTPGPNEKQDQTPTTGKPEAQIDKSSVEADIKKEQERLKKKTEQTTTKESYDAYDVILEYLIDTEQVDTIEEAHYVMLEMNEETVGNIIEQYENYLLAEEIEEWVNDLVEEGYDLSDYTWDEIIEYYMTETNRG
jgi:hypothetical protein